MPLSNFSDHDEDEHDIVAEYEKKESDEDKDNFYQNVGSGSENEESKENTGRRISPSSSKKQVVRNPLPKLNTERLKGEKGIHTIEKYFEGFKFHGAGYEKLDLDRIMKRLEHWGHRLFPKLDFDDFIERLEKLGTKKDLQVFIRKYRQDMISTEEINNQSDTAPIEDEDEGEPIDEFDLLIAEQIEKQKQVIQEASVKDTTSNDAFDKLLSDSNKSFQSANTVSTSSQLSDEVKERIERNRQQAIQRKLARMQAMQEGAKRKKLDGTNETQLTTSTELNADNTNIQQNIQDTEKNH